MTAFLEDRRILYFVFGQGCVACEEASPELDAFVRENPAFMVVRLDANGPHPAALGLTIKATPTYVYRVGYQGFMREGGMTATEIGAWLNAIESGEEPADSPEDAA